jgi:hypothetical protein
LQREGIVDNALDICEEQQVAPVIEVSISTEKGEIIVADIGPGSSRPFANRRHQTGHGLLMPDSVEKVFQQNAPAIFGLD